MSGDSARGIRITEAGVVAAAALARSGSGRVLAASDSSLYIDVAGSILCIGPRAIGSGPINAIASLSDEAGLAGLAITDGDKVAIEPGRILFQRGPVLATGGMRAWTPPPWPAVPSAGRLQASITRLIGLARERVPPIGIGPVVLGMPSSGGIAGAMARKAILGVAMLEDWLMGELGSDEEMSRAGQQAVQGLMGLGPGLTPSGDDFLIGAGLALRAVGRADAADAIRDLVHAAPAEATSAISRAHLGAALDGHAGATSHAVISALLIADEASFPALIDRIDGIGHCSGWDTLAGITVALAAASARMGS